MNGFGHAPDKEPNGERQSAVADRGGSPRHGHPAGSRARRQRLAGVTILVVEDDQLSREALELILAHYGATVVSAATVRDALAQFDRFDPTLVVSDIGLPGDDGYSLIRTIRARDLTRSQHTPAIAVSGFGGVEIGERALAAGFDIFLQKPVEVATLIATAAQFLGGGSA